MNNRILQLTLLFLTFNLASFAANYTTIADGSWDTGSIWSMDGVNPCNCVPSTTVGHTINVNHSVVTAGNMNIKGNTVLNVNGLLSSTAYFFQLNDATMNVNGDADLDDFDIMHIDGVLNLNYGSTLIVHDNVIVDGTINMNFAYFMILNGNLQVNKTGNINMYNGSKLDPVDGNVGNYGDFHICATCCSVAGLGNWTNYGPQGVVTGDGYVQVNNGNAVNNNVWSSGVDWCASQNGTNMPIPENCITVDDVCGAIVLPVLFGDFFLVAKNDELEVNWQTISEVNCDRFIIERSLDGMTYEIVGTVYGNGTSQIPISYMLIDSEPKKGVSYYRIKQFDFDGNPTITPLRSIYMDEEISVVVKSVNLMGQEVEAGYSGLVIDILENGTSVKRFQW